MMLRRLGKALHCSCWTALLIIFLGLSSAAYAAQITLAWDPNDPTPDGYRLYQRTEGSAYNYSAPVWSGTQATCTLANLAEGVTTYFVVRAYVAAMESDNSNETSYRYTPPTSYTLNASAGANGAISPSGSVSVSQGSSQTFGIQPTAHYHTAAVSIDGTPIGAVGSYTFSNVNANHSIAASFAIDTYAITATAGANGAIQPAGTIQAPYGTNRAYTIQANAGYRIANVIVDGVSRGALASYTFSAVTAAHSISASFTPDIYMITASAGSGGTIMPSGQVAVAGGGGQDFSITAENGYGITDVRVDGASVGTPNAYHFDGVSSAHTIEAIFKPVNQPPLADAGPDQTVDEAQVVQLSGLNSHDSDDGIAAFRWEQIQGPAVALSTTSQAQSTFTAPDVGVTGEALVFELQVTDKAGNTATDTCIVNVTWVNMPPVAATNADQTVAENSLVMLDGSNSADSDDGLAAYRWLQTQGPTVTLFNPASPQPSFTTPDVGPQGATLRFQLTVTDKGGLQDTAACLVTVGWINEAPVADAGPDQQVLEGSLVTLNGANSSDSDDGIAAYRWSQTDGPPVTLSDAGSARPTFSAPPAGEQGTSLGFRLTVIDQGNLQRQDACVVNILHQNLQPTAVAGPDQTVAEGSRVQLDGSQSNDPDDGLADLHWTQISGPAVTLSDPQAQQPIFTAPDVGPDGISLTFQLTVSDYSGLKAQDTCIVNVTWQNLSPTAEAGGDQQASINATVYLDGSASHDPDDGIGTYYWKQVAGTPVTLLTPSAALTTFLVPPAAAGNSLVFELTVTDMGGLQSVGTCRIDVAASVADTIPPVITITNPAGHLVIVNASSITLQGKASDNSGILRVEWSSDSGASGVAQGTTTWRIDQLHLQRWMNRITVTAVDAAGNRASDSIFVFGRIWR